MKLTGNIILRALQNARMIRDYHLTQTCSQLEGPLIYNQYDQPEPGWLYVIDTSQSIRPEHFQRENICLLLTGPDQPDLSASLPASWIRTDPSLPFSKVLNLISRTFSRYNAWKDQLEKIQARMGTVDEMLEASVGVFGNPIMVLDSELSMVNWVSEGYFDRKHLSFFSEGKDRIDVINAILQDPRFVENRLRTDCYWGPEYLTGFRSICLNIVRGNEPQYCISVLEDNTVLGDADLDLLSILGFYVKYVIYHQDRRVQSRFQNLSAVLYNILTDRTFDYLEASRQLCELGWGKGDLYLCLIYQLTFLDRSVLPAMSVCRYMEDQYSCASFMHADHVVNFFNLTKTGLSEEDVQRQLKPFIRDSFLKAGFSRSVRGHLHLRQQYLQAQISLDVGSRRNPYQWIHYFDHLSFDFLLEQMTQRLPAEMVMHPGILRLEAHDQSQGTEYVKTLRAYLDSGQNAVHAARLLYIHRSTFLYRMEKIREIMESDLGDPETFLYAALSLRLLQSTP